ncbi:uncharacterized protein LOC142237821 [Haematobia irritans]|uniref:uncharacterized protein LOC142237821 n=1 Tax=Haematobia irritans TaxID=7368 RepID=UPI003F4FC41B
MWMKYQEYKNHFLQTELQHVKATTINDLVSKEFEKRRSNHTDFPVGGLTCVSSSYFDSRTNLAYGLWALPKLIKEIGSDDNETQYRALQTLSEYIVNPLHAQRAIIQYQIVRRCQNLFFRIRMKYETSKSRYADRILDIFFFKTMLRLMDQFYNIVRDREEHMLRTSKILSLLTEQSSATIFLLNTYKVMGNLMEIWQKDPCVPFYPEDLWLHLQHFLVVAPDEAVACGFFEIFYTRIKARVFQFHRYDMKCLALLLRCEEGQRRFLEADAVKEMYEILRDPLKKLDTYENVIFVLMNGMFAKPIMWRCREFTNLPTIITTLAQTSAEQNMQLFCLQLLRELGEMPCIKRYIQENCLEILKTITCGPVINKKFHTELIYWLQREIYHTSDLRRNLRCF